MITQNTPENNQVVEDEISLKDIIKEIRSWKDLFVKNFKKIFIVGLIGGIIGFAYAYFSKPLYTAKLTFVMRADANSTAISGLAGLSSLIGVGTSASSVSSLDRITELLGSERIVGEALLTEVNINGRNDLLINHYVNIKKLKDEWAKDTLLSKVQFKGKIDLSDLNRPQRSAIKIISSQIAGQKGILSKSFDKKSGIVSVNVVDQNEHLAIVISRTIYDILVKFYTAEAVSSISAKVDILQQKVDSIQYALNSTQRASAVSSDQGLGLLLQQDRIDQKKLGLKESVLTVMYGEALKNLEQLNFILATTSPSFSVIDQPYSPIKPAKKSKVIFTLGFSILFGFLFFAVMLVKLKFSKLLN
jgi:uncharacterized protein involved in exopolysaccharide biosynthesis